MVQKMKVMLLMMYDNVLGYDRAALIFTVNPLVPCEQHNSLQKMAPDSVRLLCSVFWELFRSLKEDHDLSDH